MFDLSSIGSSANIGVLLLRKAAANVEAVDERQALQTLTREEKTGGRALGGLRDTFKRFEEKKTTLEGEVGTLEERKAEVHRSLF